MLEALDESPLEPHRPDLLDMIIDLANDEAAPMHLLMTSRPDPDIAQALAAFKHEEIVLKNASIDADIALFVAEQLQSNRRLHKWRNHQAQIEQVFASKAQGV